MPWGVSVPAPYEDRAGTLKRGHEQWLRNNEMMQRDVPTEDEAKVLEYVDALVKADDRREAKWHLDRTFVGYWINM